MTDEPGWEVVPIDLAAVRARRSTSRRQLPEQVATYVRELIISGSVRPGEHLRIDRIAAEVGVSNTPVREGLLALRSEGFVSQAPRRGFVVSEFTRQDVRDLFWVQARLAGELSARAALRITSDQLARLTSNVDQYRDAVDEDLIADLGHAFHREINLASRSDRLALLLGGVVRQLPNTFYATIEGHVTATRADHPRILEALRRRDSERARRLMREHIARGADRLIEELERRGAWRDAEAPGCLE